jgi:hypothetical protein
MSDSLTELLPEHRVAPSADLRLGYGPPSGYDEATDRGGASRPHWTQFFNSLRELGSPQMARRWREAKDLIRENGVTYNVYGDPDGVARPWQLDPIPLLLPSTEANVLERALVQRARLLEVILADLYGPQRLLKEGFLPPELIFPNPGFLRSVHGVEVPGGRYLHLYAANLGRGADGRWRVIGDRTQAPSGAGYALENRIVMTRTLPEAFRDCRVHRLARFFQTFRDTLRSIAPRNKDNPRVVLLTPGPYNETYFEHAYLARYLGYTLVEGGDLTVRDNRVFLKVLGGLQPVEVIFRRLDDDFCDPLELRPDSFLGVPGPRYRTAGNSGTPGVPASPLPVAAGRGTATGICSDMVVRRTGVAPLRTRPPDRPCHQAGIPCKSDGTGVSRGPVRVAARGPRGADSPPAARLRRAEPARPLINSCSRRRPARQPEVGGAFVPRGRNRGRVCVHAGRLNASECFVRHDGGVDAARRRE